MTTKKRTRQLRHLPVGALMLLSLGIVGCGASGATDVSVIPAPEQLTEEQALLLLQDLQPETREVFDTYRIDPRILDGLSASARSGILVTVAEANPYTSYPSDHEQELALAEWMVNCLVDSGLPAVRQEGTTIIDMNGDNIAQTLEATEADELCTAEASIRYPLRPAATTREEWQPLYDRQLATVACLQNLGFDVPSPPSFDEYVDSSGTWVAYDAVPSSLSEEEWIDLNRDCPQ